MNDLDSIYKKNEDVVTRDIDGELFLLPLIRTRDEINALFTLSEMASKIWDMVDGKRSVDQIKKKVLKEYNVEEETIEKDLKNFIKDAKEINIIKKVK